MTLDEILEDAKDSFDKIQRKGFVNINDVELDYYLVGSGTTARFKLICKFDTRSRSVFTKVDKYIYDTATWGVPIFSKIEDEEFTEKDMADIAGALNSSRWQQLSYFDFIGKLYNNDNCYDFFEIDLHEIENTVFL